MSNGSMEQVQNRVNSDLRRQFRSFRGFIKKPEKAWSAPTLKWFSLYSIGILAGMWTFIFHWTKLEPWIGFAVISGMIAIIAVPILFVENVRLTGKSHNGQPQINRYISAIIFIGFAIVSALVGWFAGTSVRKFIEIVTSNPMSR
ncbi:hypothetical protein F4Z99_12270 [Candidatus Poribacteria bacterium]|nr:hypothetical protein [Candidatus Poribacteria bacterium]MYB02568.1 hypothetical protein [Candidatus Poribacteria bacterium]